MLKRDEVLKWLGAYDIQKYPASVYDELVVEQRPYPGRIKILGAWKTGCLRADGRGRVYVDKNGNAYSFTGRWNPDSPVGYSTWIEISENEKEINEKIPKDFSEAKPAIVAELESRDGFGFIWALFVLHCFFRLYYVYANIARHILEAVAPRFPIFKNATQSFQGFPVIGSLISADNCQT